ncbi:unnamed protein product [Ambrosiozyma monospora]|uniref:Unnamed protein product n=1 Tax=Ambrosiozyma monospora TaxID=43982 RepID=A0A9W7DKV8_AMBMO|nr:unnamed protein product [Ambrosiozyma monospora]
MKLTAYQLISITLSFTCVANAIPIAIANAGAGAEPCDEASSGDSSFGGDSSSGDDSSSEGDYSNEDSTLGGGSLETDSYSAGYADNGGAAATATATAEAGASASVAYNFEWPSEYTGWDSEWDTEYTACGGNFPDWLSEWTGYDEFKTSYDVWSSWNGCSLCKETTTIAAPTITGFTYTGSWTNQEITSTAAASVSMSISESEASPAITDSTASFEWPSEFTSWNSEWNTAYTACGGNFPSWFTEWSAFSEFSTSYSQWTSWNNCAECKKTTSIPVPTISSFSCSGSHSTESAPTTTSGSSLLSTEITPSGSLTTSSTESTTVPDSTTVSGSASASSTESISVSGSTTSSSTESTVSGSSSNSETVPEGSTVITIYTSNIHHRFYCSNFRCF